METVIVLSCIFSLYYICFYNYSLSSVHCVTKLCEGRTHKYREIKAGEGKGLHCFDKARKVTVTLNPKNHQPKWALGHRLGGFGPEGDQHQAAHWSYSDFCSRLSLAENGFRTRRPGVASQSPDAPSHSPLPPVKSGWFNLYSNLHQ